MSIKYIFFEGCDDMRLLFEYETYRLFSITPTDDTEYRKKLRTRDNTRILKTYILV